MRVDFDDVVTEDDLHVTYHDTFLLPSVATQAAQQPGLEIKILEGSYDSYHSHGGLLQQWVREHLPVLRPPSGILRGRT